MQKNRTALLCAGLGLALFAACDSQALPIGFESYQGRLIDSGQPANGSYDLSFNLFNFTTGGIPIAAGFTNLNTPVSNGLFTVTLRFSPIYFNGAILYLEVAARTNGGGAYLPLSPRQMITSTPYSLYSLNSDIATQVASGGYVPLSALPMEVLTNGASGIAVSGMFSGDGSGLSNLTHTVTWQAVSGTGATASPNQAYMLTNNGPNSLTLPTTANVGDVVTVSSVGTNGWAVVATGSQFILGSEAQWAALNSGNLDWTALACSADGTKVVAAEGYGYIYTSVDSGSSWAAQNSGSRNWSAVASSADGTKLVAAFYGESLYTSVDSGTNWTAQNSGGHYWSSVASSSDGTKLVAADFTGYIYTSVDSGTNWTAQNSGQAVWNAVASSSDGSKLVAAEYDGYIHTSIDSGTNWTTQDSGQRDWQSVASSADGTRLAACDVGGFVSLSFDSGVHWIPQNVAAQLVAFSADGDVLFAAPQPGVIQKAVFAYTGAGGASGQFQYLGNGVWQPLGAQASTLTGTIPLASIPASVVTNFETGVTLAGTFQGDGGALTGISPNSLGASGSATFQPAFYTSRGNYTLTVPPTANSMTVELWGAGGQSGNTHVGGGGAFSSVTLPVAPGQTYVVVVGGGGSGAQPSPGGTGSAGGGNGGQGSSLFFYDGSSYIMHAVAGGGGGGGKDGNGGAGGNPGAGGYGGANGNAGGNGFAYASNAITTGLSTLSQMGGSGGGSAIVFDAGGGGGYGGGSGAGINAGLIGCGGGSYGSTIIGGSGSAPGNAAASHYRAPLGSADQDGLAVVTFSAPTVSFGNEVQATGFAGDGSLLTGIRASQLDFANPFDNTMIGYDALYSDTTGASNTVVGYAAAALNTIGSRNTGLGSFAINHIATGGDNVAIGFEALAFNSTGNSNIGVGSMAGIYNSTGNNNIYIGNSGASESGVIRIGTSGTHTDTYLAGQLHGNAAQFGGSVGVGIAPQAALHVYGASGGQLRLQDSLWNKHWSIYTEAISGNQSGSGNLLFNTDSGVFASISHTSGAFSSSSDLRLKKDINNLGSVLDRLLQLRPVSYRFKRVAESEPQTDGFIAQEVEPLFPEVVSDVGGYKGIAYSELVPVTVGAIQELNRKVEEKDAKLEAQEAEIQDLKQNIAQLKAAIAHLVK